MRIRFVLPALMIGAGLLLPVQTPALAKTSYKAPKFKKYKGPKMKGRKIKGKKMKTRKAVKPHVTKHR
jgi:hypothetical protein